MLREQASDLLQSIAMLLMLANAFGVFAAPAVWWPVASLSRRRRTRVRPAEADHHRTPQGRRAAGPRGLKLVQDTGRSSRVMIPLERAEPHVATAERAPDASWSCAPPD
jgi:hypothetical protein